VCPTVGHTATFDDLLRTQVLQGGWRPAAELYVNPDEPLAAAGKTIFESPRLSLNGAISCRTCHQDKFGSADGIPNAAATGTGHLLRSGSDKVTGPERLLSGAKQLPRNTLAFWGRGAIGFDTFFWDGRVRRDPSSGVISQFGAAAPATDPLIVAAHLPVVEIREMLREGRLAEQYMHESVEKSRAVYNAIARNLRAGEPAASRTIASTLRKDPERLEYLDYARAIAAFIRSEFRLKPTKLERFMYRQGDLSDAERRGGHVFYGKGGCVTCHRGPHFSDFEFHAMPFPQLGFGKNGFGVDYGRYNATFDSRDLYKFRTPPLYNVARTAPYGHSGALRTLDQVVIAHFDPLRMVDLSHMDSFARHELFRRMAASADVSTRVKFLSDDEVRDVVAFLHTLSF
jgi:cytochrome c peroxidase